MKLVSWNVNGLRACMGKGFLEYFIAKDADCFCIQETKLQQDQIVLQPEGYHVFWNSAEKKGYSGTAVFTKRMPLNATFGLGIPEHDREGRVITLEFDAFYLVNVYTPNSQRELLRLGYRMTWEDAFADYLQALNTNKPVLVCGDLNVAHKEIDIKNPKSNGENAGFTPQEREKMTALLARGFVDTFRFLHPDAVNRYSWWSYMMKARERNVGWRIDYFLISERMAGHIVSADIEDQVMGSDHCPVTLELSIP
jgi:exodeoxyribonuclease-3